MWWFMIVVIILLVVAIEAAIEDESRIGYFTCTLAGFIVFGIGLHEGDHLNKSSDEIIKPTTKIICEETNGVKTCDTTYIYKFKKETEDE